MQQSPPTHGTCPFAVTASIALEVESRALNFHIRIEEVLPKQPLGEQQGFVCWTVCNVVSIELTHCYFLFKRMLPSLSVRFTIASLLLIMMLLFPCVHSLVMFHSPSQLLSHLFLASVLFLSSYGTTHHITLTCSVLPCATECA